MRALTHRRAVALPLVAVTLCLAPGLLAQADRRTDTRSPATRADVTMDLTRGVYLASLDAEDRSLRKYAGQRLLNAEGAELGAVRDFIVHVPSSRVRYAVVSSGGVLGGIGNSLRLVPVEALRRSDDQRAFVVDILQSAWLQLPPIHDEDYVADRFNISAAQHSALSERFGGATQAANRTSPPATRNANAVSHEATRVEESGLVRASALRGRAVRAADRHVGNIENIIIDLEHGAAAALLDAAGEFTGTTGKYLIPLSGLQMTLPLQNTVATTLTRADFDHARPSTFRPLYSTAPSSAPANQEPALTPTGRTTPAR